MFKIVSVQNLAIRYVTTCELQINVPNFKVIKMFVLHTLLCSKLLFTVHLIVRETATFCQKIDLFSKNTTN